MTKEQLLEISKEKKELLLGYVVEMLSEYEGVRGEMNFGFGNINNQNNCVVDIEVPEINLKSSLNMEIPMEFVDVFYGELLNGFLETFLEHETMGVSQASINDDSFSTSVVNSNGSKVKLNFMSNKLDFSGLVQDYNRRIVDYVQDEMSNSQCESLNINHFSR